MNGALGRFALVFAAVAVAPAVMAQQPGPMDPTIDAFRARPAIGPSDQGRIAEWVRTEVGRYIDFAAFRKRFRDQHQDAKNSAQFTTQFITQTSNVAATEFGKTNLNAEIAYVFAQVLVDMDRAETVPGLLAGVAFSDVRVRFLCVKGLIARRSSIESDDAQRDQIIQKLQAVALAEDSEIVLKRIYAAIAFPRHVDKVFDVYMAMMDKRLAFRRKLPVNHCDGTEVPALEYFRIASVSSSLTPVQKSQLAARVAVLLRMDAQRYQSDELASAFLELDHLERELDAAEDVLKKLGASGGDIRGTLSNGGYGARAVVLREAYRWVGHPTDQSKGTLNQAPWNVPVGAP